MKYALLFFILSTSAVSARTITSFRDSTPITTIVQFMYDVGEDIPVSVHLSDKKMKLKDLSLCTNVSAADVLGDVEAAIKKVMRFYPDEDLPVGEALADMEDYLDNKPFRKCAFATKSAHSFIKSVYYVDGSDKIHLRLDNVALVAE